MKDQKSPYYKLFSSLEPVVMAPGLENRIWRAVETHHTRMARVMLALTCIVATLSFVGVLVAVRAVFTDITQTGITQYISLAFSDSAVILASWKEFGLLVASSLPFAMIAGIFAGLFIFMSAIRIAAHNLRESLWGTRFA